MESLRKVLTIFFFALIAILIQGTVLRTFLPTAYLPNFLVGMLVFVAFMEITVVGVCMSFLLGLLLDLFSSQLIGPWAGSYVAVFAFFSLFAQRVYVGSFLVVMVTGVFASILSSITYIFMIMPYVRESGNSVSTIAFEALLSGLVAPLVFYAIQKVYPREQQVPGLRN